MNAVRVGCCGFPMARREYFARFPVVEVQRTFYQPPRIETLRRWREEAPPDFEFTLKAWQLITHTPASPTYRRTAVAVPEQERACYGNFRPTEQVHRAWRATLACARALRARALVFQCPPSFIESEEHMGNMARFFSEARRDAADLLFGWEPRGGWARETVERLCAELNLLLVVDPFAAAPPAAGLHYFRLHGIGGYGYRYSDDDLERLRSLCVGETYCLFNNTHMADDASRFLAMAGSDL